MSLRMDNVEALLAQLDRLDAETAAKALTSGLRESFKPVLEQAQQLCPKDTGALAASLRIATAKPKDTDTIAAAGIIVVDDNANARQARVAAAAFGEGQSSTLPPSRRWHFPELGTSKEAARPYLRPALDANAQGVLERLGVEVWKRVQKALNKGGG